MISLLECHNECSEMSDGESACEAYALRSDDIGYRCYLYRKGPYTHGDGTSTAICYIMTRGIIHALFRHYSIKNELFGFR